MNGVPGAETVVVLPFRGEFGLKLFGHVPAVNAIRQRKIVYCEEGEQALFPGAAQWIEVARNDDSLRRNTYRRDSNFVATVRAVAAARWPNARLVEPDITWPLEPFAPTPYVPQDVGAVDIVVCPRWRAYGASKNWPHWPALVAGLKELDLNVFAGGAADSSVPVPCPQAWKWERPLDATIAAMQKARLVVATYAGLAVLAVLLGKPLLLITHGHGLIAPGPVSDEHGRVMEKAYGAADLSRLEAVNHRGSAIVSLHAAWDRPAAVAHEAWRMFELTRTS